MPTLGIFPMKSLKHSSQFHKVGISIIPILPMKRARDSEVTQILMEKSGLEPTFSDIRIHAPKSNCPMK